MVKNAVVNARDVQTELQRLRDAIDGVDDKLAALLVCRAKLSRRAQAAKRQAGVPILDCNREVEIQCRYERVAPGSASVADAIVEWCRS